MEAWREELYHSGVPGMKWGVRRYQNPDGSLTEAGRAHYGPERRLVRKAEKAASKYERLDRKYQKNEARISKIRNNHKKMARAAKLQEKRERLELKKAKLNKRVTRAQQTFMRGEEPGFFDRRAVKKNAELD